jgi:hypothetical protein
VTAATGNVPVAGFTAIESGATFHIIPATGDLTVRRYYAVSAATAALVWSAPTVVSAVPGSFDSITIAAAKYKAGDFRVDGTADFDPRSATTITLWQKNSAGVLVRITDSAVPAVPLAPIPVGESPFVLWRVTCRWALHCMHARAYSVFHTLHCSACARTLLLPLLLLQLLRCLSTTHANSAAAATDCITLTVHTISLTHFYYTLPTHYYQHTAVAGVAPALPSQGTWVGRFRAGASPVFNAAVPPLIWAVSSKGGQFPVDTNAPGFVITPARRLQSTFTVEAFN